MDYQTDPKKSFPTRHGSSVRRVPRVLHWVRALGSARPGRDSPNRGYTWIYYKNLRNLQQRLESDVQNGQHKPSAITG